MKKARPAAPALPMKKSKKKVWRGNSDYGQPLTQTRRRKSRGRV